MEKEFVDGRAAPGDRDHTEEEEARTEKSGLQQWERHGAKDREQRAGTQLPGPEGPEHTQGMEAADTSSAHSMRQQQTKVNSRGRASPYIVGLRKHRHLVKVSPYS